MATSKKLTDSGEVTKKIKKLDPAVGKIVQALRTIILSTDKEIGERLKWNNPSFISPGK